MCQLTDPLCTLQLDLPGIIEGASKGKRIRCPPGRIAGIFKADHVNGLSYLLSFPLAFRQGSWSTGHCRGSHVRYLIFNLLCCVLTLAYRLISILMHADMILMVLDASKADIQKRLLIAVR